MGLIAEQLVDEWMNRQGFFTLRGVKKGVHEIDLLGVRPANGGLEGWHVEVQVSFRPVSFIGKLSPEQQDQLGVGHPNSSKARPKDILKAGMAAWAEKKFTSPLKARMRNRAWKSIDWEFKFVHGRVYEQSELSFLKSYGIELIRFEDVLKELCEHKPGDPSGGAGTDLAEIIRFYSDEIGGRKKGRVN